MSPKPLSRIRLKILRRSNQEKATANSSTKIVLGIEQGEVKPVARRFRFTENIVTQL
jgi:hypothetical protein